MINIHLDQIPINITEHIDKFRQFLVAGWPYLDDLMEYHDWDNDDNFIDYWLQANWEILVEREILEGKGFLSQFSMTHLSNRVTYPEKKPGYSVIGTCERGLINQRTSEETIFNKPLRLYSFRTYENRAFGLYPPFDLACLVDDSTQELFVFPFSDLKFYLIKI